MVGRRLARLSGDANRVLKIAAVIGPEFEVPVFQATEGLDEETLFAAIEEGTGARLLTEIPGPTPRYRFAHALVRDTLYEELSAARRVAVHHRVAQAIERVRARGRASRDPPPGTWDWSTSSEERSSSSHRSRSNPSELRAPASAIRVTSRRKGSR